MGSARVVKPGLTLDAHRVLGQRLRAMKTEALALRGEIKTALGSAAAGYQMATRVLSALDYLAHALAVEAAGEYADTVSTAELQALYRRTGEQTAGTR